MLAILYVNTAHVGLLQFRTLIAAWDKQTNRLTGPFSWACVCHFASPDLNLICLLLVSLNAVADAEPSSQALHSLFEGGWGVLINEAFFRQWARGRMALGIFDRIKWLTQKRKFCRLWNNPPILISSTSSLLLIFSLFSSHFFFKWIEVKCESVFSGWL